MMKNFIFMLFFLWTFLANSLYSQSKTELRNIFYEAESWILYEDYKEALPLYLKLHRVYPDNANIRYRIGQCYINTPGEKEKSLRFLEDAVRNISHDYKKGKFSERRAPYDALFYLANAYLINNNLERALETFNLFQNNLDPEVYDTAVVRLQIKACMNARGMVSRPVYVRHQNLGSVINRQNSEFNPVVSDDEKMLVFTRSYPFYDAIMYSTRNASGRWTAPVNMNEILKVDNYLYPTSVSHDGKDLYVYSSLDYDGIIYKTTFRNGTWSPLEKLNDNINTKYWESHATISHDNKKLFFTSNRKGTYGGLDIYVSVRDSSGKWGVAQNLGPAVNTPYNEESPFLSQDDKTLYFSSRGHYGMGGYDYFYSTLQENGQWSVPLNVGFPLNTTDDDVFYKPVNDGYQGYVAKYNPDGYGKQDIYKIEIFSDEHPRKFTVKGIAKMSFTPPGKNDRIEITARNLENSKKKPVVLRADPATGEFVGELPHGNYEFLYNAPGAAGQKRKISLPISSSSDTILIPGTILARSDNRAFLAVTGSKNRIVRKPDPVTFRLKMEPNSLLSVRWWNGKKFLSEQQFVIKDSVFIYSVRPEKGVNGIEFHLTDSYSNTAKENVYVTYREQSGTARIPDHQLPISGINMISYPGISNDGRMNKLVSLQISLPEREKPSFYAGLVHSWKIALAAGAGLLLFFLVYKKRRKRSESRE